MGRFVLAVDKYLHVLQQGRKRISAGSQRSGFYQVYVQQWLYREMVWFAVRGLVLIKTQIPIFSRYGTDPLNNTMVCRPQEAWRGGGGEKRCHVTRRDCDSPRGRIVLTIATMLRISPL
jgi:hypothetical protein